MNEEGGDRERVDTIYVVVSANGKQGNLYQNSRGFEMFHAE